MEIRIKRLSLSNFRGIRAWEYNNGEGSPIVEISGPNGCGKTTVAAAWSWLLTGRDHTGGTPAVKPLTTDFSDGDAIGSVEPTLAGSAPVVVVEADLVDDEGRAASLRRAYREVRQRTPTGETGPVTGHTTDYTLNGVPVTAAEWNRNLEDIFGPVDRVRLLTDPAEFARRPWRERRALLVELAAERVPTLRETLETEAEVAPLLGHLDTGHGDLMDPEDLRVKTQRELTATRRELDQIPARIDEQRRVPRPATEVTEEEVEELFEAARKVDYEVAEASATAERSRAREEVADLRARIAERRAALAEQRRAALEPAELRRRGFSGKLVEAEAAHADAERHVVDAESRVELAEARLAGARRRLEEFEAGEAERCPTCGQELPSEAKERRNEARASLQEEAATAERELSAARRTLDDRRSDRKRAADRVESAETELRKVEAEVDRLRHAAEGGESEDEELRRLEGQLADAERVARSTTESVTLEAATERSAAAWATAREAEAERTRWERFQAASRRIEELRERAAELGAVAHERERILHLLGRLDVIRADALETAVAGVFGLARFRLWRRRLNGTLEPTCEILGPDGAAWGDGLNHGAEILVGLDIIAALQEHWGVALPVWLDHGEALTETPPAPAAGRSQLFVLIARPGECAGGPAVREVAS